MAEESASVPDRPGSSDRADRADRAGHRAPLLQRLHALSGVVPLGAFVVFHLWVTLSIAGSREIYDRQIALLHRGPLLGILELVFVILPLGYHALYGVARTLQPKDPQHGYDSDLMVLLERASGVVVLVFLGFHVWAYRGLTWLSGLAVSSYSTKLVAELSSTYASVPLVALGYLVGAAATIFHLVSGLTSFCATHGFTRSVAARRRAQRFFRGVGVLLFAVAAALILQIATGARLFPAEGPASPDEVCGPAAVSPPAPPHVTTPPSASAPLPSPVH